MSAVTFAGQTLRSFVSGAVSSTLVPAERSTSVKVTTRSSHWECAHVEGHVPESLWFCAGIVERSIVGIVGIEVLLNVPVAKPLTSHPLCDLY